MAAPDPVGTRYSLTKSEAASVKRLPPRAVARQWHEAAERHRAADVVPALGLTSTSGQVQDAVGSSSSASFDYVPPVPNKQPQPTVALLQKGGVISASSDGLGAAEAPERSVGSNNVVPELASASMQMGKRASLPSRLERAGFSLGREDHDSSSPVPSGTQGQAQSLPWKGTWEPLAKQLRQEQEERHLAEAEMQKDAARREVQTKERVDEIQAAVVSVEARLDAALAGLEARLAEQGAGLEGLRRELLAKPGGGQGGSHPVVAAGSSGDIGAPEEPSVVGHAAVAAMVEDLRREVEEQGQDVAALAALDTRVALLERQLEDRPQSAVEASGLEARLALLEERPQGAAEASGLEARLAALGERLEENAKQASAARLEQLSETVVLRGRMGRMEAALKSAETKLATLATEGVERQLAVVEEGLREARDFMQTGLEERVQSAVERHVGERLHALETACAAHDQRLMAIQSRDREGPGAPEKPGRRREAEEVEQSRQAAQVAAVGVRLQALERRLEGTLASPAAGRAEDVSPATATPRSPAEQTRQAAQQATERPTLKQSKTSPTLNSEASPSNSAAGIRRWNSGDLAEVMRRRRASCEEWVSSPNASKADFGAPQAPGKASEAVVGTPSGRPLGDDAALPGAVCGPERPPKSLVESSPGGASWVSEQSTAEEAGRPSALPERPDEDSLVQKFETCFQSQQKTLCKLRDDLVAEDCRLADRIRQLEDCVEGQEKRLSNLNDAHTGQDPQLTDRLEKLECRFESHEKTFYTLRDEYLAEALQGLHVKLADDAVERDEGLQRLERRLSDEIREASSLHGKSEAASLKDQLAAFETTIQELGHATSQGWAGTETLRKQVESALEAERRRRAEDAEAQGESLRALELRLSGEIEAVGARCGRPETEPFGERLAAFAASLEGLGRATSENAAGREMLRRELEAVQEELHGGLRRMESAAERGAADQERLHALERRAEVDFEGLGQLREAHVEQLHKHGQCLAKVDQQELALQTLQGRLDAEVAALQETVKTLESQSGRLAQPGSEDLERPRAAAAEGQLPARAARAPAPAAADATTAAARQLPLLAAALRRAEAEAAALQRRLAALEAGPGPTDDEGAAQLRELHGRLLDQAAALRRHCVAVRQSCAKEEAGNYLRIVYTRLGLVTTAADMEDVALGAVRASELTEQLHAAEDRLRSQNFEEFSALRSQFEDQASEVCAIQARVEVLAGEFHEFQGQYDQAGAGAGPAEGVRTECEEVGRPVHLQADERFGHVSIEDLRGLTPRQETAELGQRLDAVERYVDDRLNRLQGVRRGLHQLAELRTAPVPQASVASGLRAELGERPKGTSSSTDDRLAALEQRYLSMLEVLVSS